VGAKTPVRQADAGAIREAAALVRAGLLVGFPTETVYGLGALALDPVAVARIFVAKGRPPDNPLIVHLASPKDLKSVVTEVSEVGQRLAATFWPGPLTLVMGRGSAVPDIVTAGLATVGVRIPAHPVALELIAAVGAPVAAPSGNRSGRPSPTQAQHVVDDLDGRIAMVLDGGKTQVGLESTVVDVTGPRPLLLRRGGVSLAALEQCLGPGTIDQINLQVQKDAAARSPGLRHRHYAPQARVEVCLPGAAAEVACVAVARGDIAVVLVQSPQGGGEVTIPGHLIRGQFTTVAMPENLQDYARELFGTLRALDRLGPDLMVIEAVPRVGLGVAIMDRLARAAQGSRRG